MEISKYLIFLTILLMAVSASSASEANMKSQSNKLMSKLLGMKKQQNKSKMQRKSTRLPKMNFLGGSPFGTLSDDSLQMATPRQDFVSLLGGPSRISGYENSPIYYVRLPPTPYMYTPGLGYISQPSSPVTAYHGNAGNPFMNLPINFLSNGQPNGAYDFSMPELISSAFPGKGFLRQEPPVFGRKSFFDDSSVSTHLKGRFDFNGRPENIFILPDSPYFLK